jgi:hypothetical protein
MHLSGSKIQEKLPILNNLMEKQDFMSPRLIYLTYPLNRSFSRE